MKPAIGFPVTLVLTCLLGAFFYTTYPMFVATEALAKSREIGVLTPELEVIIRADDYKSSLVVYASWGLVAGIIGAIASSGKGLGIRLIVGCVLGIILGALTNYISDQYALRSAPPLDAIQYWIKRYSLVQLPMALAVAIPASFGAWANLPTNLVKAALAGVFAACLYSFLMGLVTPLEQVQFNYPQFTANSFILLLSFNLLSYLGIVWGGAKKTTENVVDTASVPATPS
ncbi:MAG: hypothetical protein SFV81_08335 [Pirellulaceae bacterium]|nr:hypothetical protein [Pirellulaceae bacterium]